MIRDTFFDGHRFVNVCRKEMVENWKSLLLRWVMMYGTLAIALVWNAYWEYGRYNRSIERITDGIWSFGMIAFAWGIVVMGCFSASFIMERMKTKNGRTAMLMLPATQFEKFFARWLVFTFGFLVAYLVAYRLADWTRMLLMTVLFPEEEGIAQVPLLACLIGGGRESLTDWTLFSDCRQFLMGIGGYFFLQSFYVLGSSIWPKNTFLKTFAAKMVIFIVYVTVGGLLAETLFAGKHVGLTAEPAEDTVHLLFTIGFFALALFNWVLAYYRFKESEIINRW